MESGKVQGIPLEETLAKARKITAQAAQRIQRLTPPMII